MMGINSPSKPKFQIRLKSTFSGAHGDKPCLPPAYVTYISIPMVKENV